MRRKLASLPLVLLMLSTSACFHQVVQTGLAAGPTVVTKGWVSTWMWGLVPAQPIDVRSECPSGVATIATQQTFGNGFLSMLTLGIWAPQSVTVTCAGGRAELPAGTRVFVVAPEASAGAQDAVIREAIQWSIAQRRIVAVAY